MKLKYSNLIVKHLLLVSAILLYGLQLQAQLKPKLFGLPVVKQELPQDFQIDLKLRVLDKDNFQMVSTLDLTEGAYIISPFSMDSFYLHYTIADFDPIHISPTSKMTEFPESTKELDPYIEREVRLIRTKTVFTQAYTIIEEGDFVAKGLIEFLVEPSCIPYDVNFEIKNQTGALSIDNVKISISAEYKP